jgi:protein-S-isoprenylcysteine O-methyltransferase Ste14
VTRTLALALLVTWMAYAWRGGALLVREIAQARRDGRWGVALTIVAGVAANLLNLAYTLAYDALGLPELSLGLPAPARVAGLCLAILAFAWIVWSRTSLGEAWSSGIDRVGALCTRGPYRVVRHPIYAGAVAFYGGLLLAQSNIPGVLAYGGHIGGFVAKTGIEDRILRSRADDYRRYAARTPWRLIPRVW